MSSYRFKLVSGFETIKYEFYSAKFSRFFIATRVLNTITILINILILIF